jgi:hypothetical protein
MHKLTLLAILAASSMMAFSQTAPIKMGLWEKKMTMDMGTGTPQNINSKSCITAETWQEMVGNMGKQREGCTSDQQKNAHGYTFTATCKTSGGGTMVTSGSSNIPDTEHIISQSHTDVTTNGKKRTMDMKSTSTFLRADCGKIKPDDPETEDN